MTECPLGLRSRAGDCWRAAGAATARGPVCGLVLLLILAATSCATGSRQEQHDETVMSGILRNMDRETEWLSVESVQLFPAERLYDYMNGAAVTYFEHHFRILAACDVIQDTARAKVELYAMATAADAQALYREASRGSEEILPAGRHGVYWAGFEPEGLFVRDRYLVRVYGYAETDMAGRNLVFQVSRALDTELRRHLYH